MTTPTRPNSLQTYQTVLYSRALHPELFALRGRRVVRHGAYELEAWVMPGSHLLRFEFGPLCACELVTDREDSLPDTGVVAAFLCAGEREFEHRFEPQRVTYMTNVQTETLSENLYWATLNEMNDYAREVDALVYSWEDDAGPNLSVIDTQRYSREVHIQAYHLQAHGGLVLRTQSIFEHDG